MEKTLSLTLPVPWGGGFALLGSTVQHAESRGLDCHLNAITSHLNGLFDLWATPLSALTGLVIDD